MPVVDQQANMQFRQRQLMSAELLVATQRSNNNCRNSKQLIGSNNNNDITAQQLNNKQQHLEGIISGSRAILKLFLIISCEFIHPSNHPSQLLKLQHFLAVFVGN